MARPKKSAFLQQIQHDVTVFSKRTQRQLSGLPEDQREAKIEALLPTQGLVEVRLRLPPPLKWVKQLRERYTRPIAQKRFWRTIPLLGEHVTWEFMGESLNDFLVAALDIVEEVETGKIPLYEASLRRTILAVWRHSHKNGKLQDVILGLVEWYVDGEKAVRNLKTLGIRMWTTTV